MKPPNQTALYGGAKTRRALGILPSTTSAGQDFKPSLSFTGQKKETVADTSVRLEQLKVAWLLLSRERTSGVSDSLGPNSSSNTEVRVIN